MGILKNKAAIITGASRGIGRATAELFLKEESNLVLTAHKNLELLQEFVGNIKRKDIKVLTIEADLTKKKDRDNLVKIAFDKFPKVDVLVNNAGVFEPVNFEDISEDQLDKMLDVNIKSTFLLTQEILKYFKKQGSGKVINVSSVAGKIGSAAAPHYAVSKAGINALTKSLARYYGRFNINVNSVAPSLIDTDMLRLMPQERLKNLIDAVPLKRLGLSIEVAHLILFLASPASDYITGQVINIDGGISMV